MFTERLLLRRPRADDAPAIFTGYASDPVVTRYLTWRPHSCVDLTRSHLEMLAATWGDEELSWVLCGRSAPELPLGMISARLAGFKTELGYVLGRAYWGRGYMLEAVRMLVERAHGEGLHRVAAFCDVDNVQSARVLEKAGMLCEGLLRRYSMHPGVSSEPRDVFMFAACS